MPKALPLACLLLAGCAGLEPPRPTAITLAPVPAARPAPEGPKSHFDRSPDPLVLAGLLAFLNDGDAAASLEPPPGSAALAELAMTVTPGGIGLWSRYAHLGIPFSEALSMAGDPMIDNRIIEAARWARHPEIRAAALRALASRHKLEDKQYFEEALIPTDPVLHFSLVEALELWDRPEALPLLERLALADASPIVRVYAAQALLARGGAAGRGELLLQLDGGAWLARAMAARTLGLFGDPADYTMLLDRLAREQANDFVVAEIAIAALRLFPRAQPAFPPMGASRGAAAAPEDSDLEPLVVTAPRLKVPPSALIDGRINAQLLRLLEQQADATPSPRDLRDPSLGTLNSVVSPNGVKLKTRYSQLGLLLTEGLAGTTDLILRDRLLKVAQSAANPQIRAAAMLAVAYDRDPRDTALFEQGLKSDDAALRLGAIEAYKRWGVQSAVVHPEDTDSLGAYLLRGRIPVERWIDDPDWVVRALAIRSAGDRMDRAMTDRLVSRLPTEQNRFVRAEILAALLASGR